ncbi:MAG: hypothetical protein WC352_05645 [Candidatus Omnitrophota bacterium]|jgi:hypothetical protein
MNVRKIIAREGLIFLCFLILGICLTLFFMTYHWMFIGYAYYLVLRFLLWAHRQCKRLQSSTAKGKWIRVAFFAIVAVAVLFAVGHRAFRMGSVLYQAAEKSKLESLNTLQNIHPPVEATDRPFGPAEIVERDYIASGVLIFSGLFLQYLIFPLYLLLRFIIWAIKTLRKP